MRIDVFTLFPAVFTGPLAESMIGRAVARGALRVEVHDIRDWAEGRHRVADDYPYGGGAGMVMKPEPIFAAVEGVLGPDRPGTWVVLLAAGGRTFTQAVARELAARRRLALVCGHYEGVDERVAAGLADDEISIGDYVLTGGEPAALVVIDAVARLLPGVLGGAGSAAEESFADGLLEYPQYTRPAVFRGMAVPEVLLSGNHAAIRRWRRKESLRRTLARRPDLLAKADLSAEDRALLDEIRAEAAAERAPRDG